MGLNGGAPKLSISLYTRGYANLNAKINALLSKNNIALDKGVIDDISAKDKAVLIINLIGVERVSNNMFSNVLKNIIEKGLVEETKLITGIADQFVDILKSYKSKDLEGLPVKLQKFLVKNKINLTTLSTLEEIEGLVRQTLFEMFFR